MSSLKPLYIIGAGGFGREVAWLVERVNTVCATWDFRGFIDDNPKLWGTEFNGHKIHGGFEIIEQNREKVWCVFAAGNAQVRRKGIRRIEPFSHIQFATLIDPSVQMGDSAAIGGGSIICAGTVVTVDVKIGRHNIINLDCTVGHDAVLGDFVTLYPSVNISGCVKVGDAVEIGTGTQVIQGIEIGSGSIVGAGSVVIRNLDSNVMAAGAPAKIIKQHEYENINYSQ